MQQSQAQQLKLMEGLLGSFNRYMDRKIKKDVALTREPCDLCERWELSIQFYYLLQLTLVRTPEFETLKDESCLELSSICDTFKCCLLCTHSRPQSLRFFWSRGRRNGGLLVNDILRRVTLGTREGSVLLLILPFIREPAVSLQVFSIVQNFRGLNTSVLSLSLHLMPREGQQTYVGYSVMNYLAFSAVDTSFACGLFKLVLALAFSTCHVLLIHRSENLFSMPNRIKYFSYICAP